MPLNPITNWTFAYEGTSFIVKLSKNVCHITWQERHVLTVIHATSYESVAVHKQYY